MSAARAAAASWAGAAAVFYDDRLIEVQNDTAAQVMHLKWELCRL